MTNGILDSSQKIVTNGLILNYDVAQLRSYPKTGTTISDLSGNNKTGTLVNGVAFDSANGGSLSFDGINDYVSVSGINGVYSSLTFTTIINTTTQTPAAGILFNRGGGGSVTGMNIRYPTSLGIGYHWNDDANTYSYDCGLVLPNNAWCFCCISISPTKVIFQINNNVAIRNYTNVTTNTTIGAGLQLGSSTNLSRYFKNKIGYASIYNRALSEAEILQNFNANRSRYGL